MRLIMKNSIIIFLMTIGLLSSPINLFSMKKDFKTPNFISINEEKRTPSFMRLQDDKILKIFGTNMKIIEKDGQESETFHPCGFAPIKGAVELRNGNLLVYNKIALSIIDLLSKKIIISFPLLQDITTALELSDGRILACSSEYPCTISIRVFEKPAPEELNIKFKEKTQSINVSCDTKVIAVKQVDKNKIITTLTDNKNLIWDLASPNNSPKEFRGQLIFSEEVNNNNNIINETDLEQTHPKNPINQSLLTQEKSKKRVENPNQDVVGNAKKTKVNDDYIINNNNNIINNNNDIIINNNNNPIKYRTEKDILREFNQEQVSKLAQINNYIKEFNLPAVKYLPRRIKNLPNEANDFSISQLYKYFAVQDAKTSHGKNTHKPIKLLASKINRLTDEENELTGPQLYLVLCIQHSYRAQEEKLTLDQYWFNIYQSLPENFRTKLESSVSYQEN